ncbi:MAG: VOC family protein [Nostoc sp. CreGUA01]|nr:VOC family protein [Nostoc sp. CreGUA01]
MFDHLSFGVSNLERSLAFYDAVLAPLGIKRIFNFTDIAGYGADNFPKFWLVSRQKFTNEVSRGFHLAFGANNRAAIDAFYEQAIASGAKDDGKPGLRPNYHPHYYAAFVIDPDGYRIEAVCHEPA